MLKSTYQKTKVKYVLINTKTCNKKYENECKFIIQRFKTCQMGGIKVRSILATTKKNTSSTCLTFLTLCGHICPYVIITGQK